MKKVGVGAIALILISVLSVSLALAFWPFDWIKEIFTGKAISTSAKIVPLVIKDVTSASRSISLNEGKTEYFSISNYNNLVYLINFDNSYKYNYEGRTYSGVLLVYHTFGTKASKPFIVTISYLSTLNKAKQLQVYFPAFDTSLSGKKMYFYVDAEGSTYYADKENDGLSDEGKEMLGVSEALTEAHLARKAPLENEAIDIKSESKDTTALEGTAFPNSDKCSDSDGGIFSETPGKVRVKSLNFIRMARYIESSDRCTSNTVLVEYYCDKDGNAQPKQIECLEGCVNGACVSSADFAFSQVIQKDFFSDSAIFNGLSRSQKQKAIVESNALNEKAKIYFNADSADKLDVATLFNKQKELITERINLYNKYGVLPIVSGGLSAKEFIDEHKKAWAKQECEQFGSCGENSGGITGNAIEFSTSVSLRDPSGSSSNENVNTNVNSETLSAPEIPSLPSFCQVEWGNVGAVCSIASPREIYAGVEFSRSAYISTLKLYEYNTGSVEGGLQGKLEYKEIGFSYGLIGTTTMKENGKLVSFAYPAFHKTDNFDVCAIEIDQLYNTIGRNLAGKDNTKWGLISSPTCSVSSDGREQCSIALKDVRQYLPKTNKNINSGSESAIYETDGPFQTVCNNREAKRYGLEVKPTQKYELIELADSIVQTTTLGHLLSAKYNLGRNTYLGYASVYSLNDRNLPAFDAIVSSSQRQQIETRQAAEGMFYGFKIIHVF